MQIQKELCKEPFLWCSLAIPTRNDPVSWCWHGVVVVVVYKYNDACLSFIAYTGNVVLNVLDEEAWISLVNQVTGPSDGNLWKTTYEYHHAVGITVPRCQRLWASISPW